MLKPGSVATQYHHPSKGFQESEGIHTQTAAVTMAACNQARGKLLPWELSMQMDMSVETDHLRVKVTQGWPRSDPDMTLCDPECPQE